jgi:Flp pilus assembly protein TadB
MPDRPISGHPNDVTKEGLAQIEAAIVAAQAATLRTLSCTPVMESTTIRRGSKRGRHMRPTLEHALAAACIVAAVVIVVWGIKILAA